MRMSMRRFTRLTNAFSKKLDNLKAAVAVHFAYYNFVRIHRTIRVAPEVLAIFSGLDHRRAPVDDDRLVHFRVGSPPSTKDALLPRVEIRLCGLQVGGFKALTEAIVHRLQ